MRAVRLSSFRCSAAAVVTAFGGSSRADYDEACGVHFESGQKLTNWSSTHEASPRRVYEPRSAQEVVRVLQLHHGTHSKVRPVGTALSPNGIGLSSSSSDNLVSLSFLDHVEVDVERKLVTVGAGARVSTVLSALAKHGLTLENFSSIQEQQLGGWTQVSAHGTGITLPPVDEMIVRLQLATPTEGIMTLRAGLGGHEDFVFRHAKVGLGSLGVVTELTLKCIPQLNLHETTTVSTRENISQGHAQRLRAHRHVRYMWLPYTDVVVAVTSNPTQDRPRPFAVAAASDALQQQPATEALCKLLHSLQPNNTTLASLQALTFAQLRDRLLDLAPLDEKHIRAVNAAEADFWRRSCGTRVDDSTNILGFDCGGEQLVLEVCFPMAGGKTHSEDPGSLAS
jgi:L-galactono-1,4-lactone dehydrogenase